MCIHTLKLTHVKTIRNNANASIQYKNTACVPHDEIIYVIRTKFTYLVTILNVIVFIFNVIVIIL